LFDHSVVRVSSGFAPFPLAAVLRDLRGTSRRRQKKNAARGSCRARHVRGCTEVRNGFLLNTQQSVEKIRNDRGDQVNQVLKDPIDNLIKQAVHVILSVQLRFTSYPPRYIAAQIPHHVDRFQAFPEPNTHLELRRIVAKQAIKQVSQTVAGQAHEVSDHGIDDDLQNV
jgi:hypothetical protein